MLDPEVNKFLKKLDRYLEEMLRLKLRKLECEDPFHYLEHYEGEEYYKFRLGDYRALIIVNHDAKALLVCLLDLRGRIYKR